jgi:uncharacterized protein (DUF488 family)
MAKETSVWTIGHSNHDLARLIGLLRSARVEAIADVRSQPFSRFSPQFNRGALRAALLGSDLRYAFLGDELGGRPPEQDLYDADGHVLYGQLAKTARFKAGIDRLLGGAERLRVAVLCSEEDPTDCHRRLLVARVITEMGVSVVHIRGDGSTVAEKELSARATTFSQGTLLAEETAPWRSTRSVSPNAPPRTSSAV